MPSPQSRSDRQSLALVLLLTIVVGAGFYAWLRTLEVPTQPQMAAEVRDAGTPDAGPPPPPLQELDPEVRRTLAGVSADQAWGEWLKEIDLARRFAAAVTAVAEGESPRASVPFLAPKGEFTTREQRKKTWMDPDSYARYDLVTRAVAAIDPGRAAAAYTLLRPHLDRAHAEIGRPGTTFDETFAQAIDRLVSVPIPAGKLELVPKGAGYAFADPELEARSPAEKHLLRMGPENMRRVQAKLEDLRRALGLRPGLSASSGGATSAPGPARRSGPASP